MIIDLKTLERSLAALKESLNEIEKVKEDDVQLFIEYSKTVGVLGGIIGEATALISDLDAKVRAMKNSDIKTEHKNVDKNVN